MVNAVYSHWSRQVWGEYIYVRVCTLFILPRPQPCQLIMMDVLQGAVAHPSEPICVSTSPIMKVRWKCMQAHLHRKLLLFICTTLYRFWRRLLHWYILANLGTTVTVWQYMSYVLYSLSGVSLYIQTQMCCTLSTHTMVGCWSFISWQHPRW